MSVTWWVEGTDRGEDVVRLRGAITESARLRDAVDQLPAVVTLDLSGVERITSPGVREWVRFIQSASDGRDVSLVRCSVSIVNQLNLVDGAQGRATVVSVMAPYYCEPCHREDAQPLEVAAGVMPRLPKDVPCPGCGEAMIFDDLPESFFGFLRATPAQ